jgi:hypothetical protein
MAGRPRKKQKNKRLGKHLTFHPLVHAYLSYLPEEGESASEVTEELIIASKDYKQYIKGLKDEKDKTKTGT